MSRGLCGGLGGVAWAAVVALLGVSLAWRGSSWVWNLSRTPTSFGGVVEKVIFETSSSVEMGERR